MSIAVVLLVIASPAAAQNPGDLDLAVFGRATDYSVKDGLRSAGPAIGGSIGVYLSVPHGALVSVQAEVSTGPFHPRVAGFEDSRLTHVVTRVRGQFRQQLREQIFWHAGAGFTYDDIPVAFGHPRYRSGIGFTPALGLDVVYGRFRTFAEGLTSFRSDGPAGSSLQFGVAFAPALRHR